MGRKAFYALFIFAWTSHGLFLKMLHKVFFTFTWLKTFIFHFHLDKEWFIYQNASSQSLLS
jgi:hypothetical protein